MKFSISRKNLPEIPHLLLIPFDGDKDTTGK